MSRAFLVYEVSVKGSQIKFWTANRFILKQSGYAVFSISMCIVEILSSKCNCEIETFC